MDKKEIKILAEYANKVVETIPNGLTVLKDALSFAVTDLFAYCNYGIKVSSFNDAVTFVKTIPVVEDFDCDEMCQWMIHGREYLKYCNQ